MDLPKVPKSILIIISLSLLSAVITLLSIFKLNNFASPSPQDNSQIKLTKSTSLSRTITVDVEGAITKPGVYELKDNSRLLDAIKKGEGLNEEADRYLIAKTFNLAKKLADEEKIYLPFLSERDSNFLTGDISTLVSINSASSSQLELLPNIGPVRATKIIDNRPYSNLEELVSKKILGEGTYNKLINLISL